MPDKKNRSGPYLPEDQRGKRQVKLRVTEDEYELLVRMAGDEGIARFLMRLLSEYARKNKA